MYFHCDMHEAERMPHVFVTLTVSQVTVGHAIGSKHKFWV